LYNWIGRNIDDDDDDDVKMKSYMNINDKPLKIGRIGVV
jgi:hypothetical protein